MHVVLVEPQIATNTGNIIRLCANTGAHLHLIEPLGFELDDARLRRSGLDYHEYATVTVHRDVGAARSSLPGRWFAFTARGTRRYTEVDFESDDAIVFGTERTGLAPDVLADFADDRLLTIPMMPDNRSLNLANAVAVVVYEAWRQRGFAGAATSALSASSASSPPTDAPTTDAFTAEALTEPPR